MTAVADSARLYGTRADELIRAEVAKQDAMWGVANDRADATKGQLLEAGIAQAAAILGSTYLQQMFPSDDAAIRRERAFEIAENDFYPEDWSGFRDYGSDVANLVVASAFLRQEIKRRLIAGESAERTARPVDKPYAAETGLPNDTAAAAS